ncbi:glycerophosphodiester phosphodiesterase [Solitalea canadensis]|uniref:Glycerophosphoryl diester phosphodiesterase n=1 Tax=Solitalea canadensis (strain ATCC 29591 / DSM 3403 / JCM 21819 / LMG 8368 / NBRC 15130 / NCIMB 12057 / USAM 9D) TaxID=929556 RepID=H8KNG8_SOLCM|nr:glycerophosphodiester phosphodiesterase family protein [Solitalea canadensis]AFD07966.1 glycerophosphoryl diester phosphodiesterase [Solitalea canadensis DSM 3403]
MRFLYLLAFITVYASSAFAQKNTWNDNIVIAHRGAWKKNNLPENSIAALKQAIKLKCYGSEFDVHMTSDSILVVNHDPEFLGIKIETSTYDELLQKSLSNGEKIPTLSNYLKAGMKQKKTKLILEIKPSVISPERTLALTEKVVAMVTKLKADKWIEYISFSYDATKKVVELKPQAKVYYLKGDVSAEQLAADKLYGADYHFSVFKKGDWFADAKKYKLHLNAWTVNKEEDMNWLLDNKVDFITTNEPELLFELIGKR